MAAERVELYEIATLYQCMRAKSSKTKAEPHARETIDSVTYLALKYLTKPLLENLLAWGARVKLVVDRKFEALHQANLSNSVVCYLSGWKEGSLGLPIASDRCPLICKTFDEHARTSIQYKPNASPDRQKDKESQEGIDRCAAVGETE